MTSRKILLTKKDNKIWMFCLEDGEIAEIHLSPADAGPHSHALGDIYVGKVKNIVSGIGGAFIEIESGVECYYHTKEAPSALFTKKSGKKQLCAGDELVVQISSEAVKTKALTVSSNLSFSGRYAVLTRGNSRMGASLKLPEAVREEWKEYLDSFKNDDYGIIIRTNAKGADRGAVCREIEQLKDACESVVSAAPARKCFSCLKKAPPQYISDLKNAYTEGLEEIVIEGEELYADIYSHFEKERPEDTGKLRLYSDKQLPLCALYGTQTAVRRALAERVWLKCGAYLVIQYTEALTVIDVNSGKYDVKRSPMKAYLKINLEAAREAARQIRLRNLSGIIIIDFINLDNDEAKKELLRTFSQYLEKDPVHTALVDVTGLQLVEVTRKKMRKPLYECISGKEDAQKERYE